MIKGNGDPVIGVSASSDPLRPGSDAVLAVVAFCVRGLARFLSHPETSRVLQRACVRAGLPIQYTQGYNPHPRISLPLPRTVGVESETDLLCVRLCSNDDEVLDPMPGPDLAACIKTRLVRQLPAGFDLIWVRIAAANVSFVPVAACYILPLKADFAKQQAPSIRRRIDELMDRSELPLPRDGTRRRRARTVDVRPYIESMDVDDRSIRVQYKITSAGTIRPDEILQLLQVTQENLAGPMQRTNVQWHEQ